MNAARQRRNTCDLSTIAQRPLGIDPPAAAPPKETRPIELCFVSSPCSGCVMNDRSYARVQNAVAWSRAGIISSSAYDAGSPLLPTLGVVVTQGEGR